MTDDPDENVLVLMLHGGTTRIRKAGGDYVDVTIDGPSNDGKIYGAAIVRESRVDVWAGMKGMTQEDAQTFLKQISPEARVGYGSKMYHGRHNYDVRKVEFRGQENAN